MSDARTDIAFETFFELGARLADRERRLMTEAIQSLQLESFVLRGGSLKINPVYGFIDKNEDLVNAYLSIGGWRLGLDRQKGVARIYHPDSSGRIRFNKSETITLIVLRMMYHEQQQAVTESTDILITIGQFREKLSSLVPSNILKPFLTRKLLGSILRKLENHSIVHFPKNSFQLNDETSLKLEPVLEHLISGASLDELNSKLQLLTDDSAQESPEESEELPQ